MLIKKNTKFLALAVFLFWANSTNSAERIAIAVMDLEPQGVSSIEAIGVSDLLRNEFISSGRFTMIERTQIDKLLKEQKIQKTGITSTEQAVEFGKILNVESVVLGSMSKIGARYHVTIRLVNVEAAEITLSNSIEVSNLDEILQPLKALVAEFIIKIPVLGKVEDASNPKEILVNLGSIDGVGEGNILKVTRIGEIKRDEKGNIIFKKKEKVGRIKLTSVQERGSIGELFESSLTVKKGDIVEIDIKEGTLNITSTPPDAVVYLNSKAVGRTPFNQKILVGKYKLAIDKADYRRYEEMIEINENKTFTKNIELTVIEREVQKPILKEEGREKEVRGGINAAWRSALLPGWGQFYNGQTGKGWLMSGGMFVAAGGTVASYFLQQKAIEEYNAQTSALANFDELARKEELYRTINTACFWLSIGIWAYSIFDAYTFDDNSSHVNSNNKIDNSSGLKVEYEKEKIILAYGFKF